MNVSWCETINVGQRDFFLLRNFRRFPIYLQSPFDGQIASELIEIIGTVAIPIIDGQLETTLATSGSCARDGRTGEYLVFFGGSLYLSP